MEVAANGGGLLPNKVNLQEKPVSQFIEWFRVINENNGINPLTGDSFHLNDILDASSIPEKSFLKEAFGSMTNDAIKGVSFFGKDGVQWYVADRNYNQNWNSNYISHILPDNPSNTNSYRLRAMFNNECRISIVLYNEKLFNHFYNEVFK